MVHDGRQVQRGYSHHIIQGKTIQRAGHGHEKCPRRAGCHRPARLADELHTAAGKRFGRRFQVCLHRIGQRAFGKRFGPEGVVVFEHKPRRDVRRGAKKLLAYSQ